MTCRVYTQLAATPLCLPLQIAAFRRYCRDLEGITITQGPFGEPLALAAGRWAVDSAAATRLGVDVVEAPDCSGMFPPQRFAAVFADTLTRIANQAEDVALIVHGDLLPDREFVAADLLRGRSVAGRGVRDLNFLHWTWTAIRRDALQTLPPPDQWGPLATIYEATTVDEFWHVEQCDPCFIHLDRIAHMPEDMPAKLAVWAWNILPGETVAECCVEVANVPIVRPRPDIAMLPPFGILGQ